HVRAPGRGKRKRFDAVGRLTHDIEARCLKDEPEPGADQFLIVGYQDAQRDGGRVPRLGGHRPSPADRGVVTANIYRKEPARIARSARGDKTSGNRVVTVNPPSAVGPRVSEPPHEATRSAIPARPGYGLAGIAERVASCGG